MLNYFFLNRVRILQHSIYRAYFTGLFNSNNALRLTDLCRNLHRSAIDIPLFHIPFFCKESIDIRSKYMFNIISGSNPIQFILDLTYKIEVAVFELFLILRIKIKSSFSTPPLPCRLNPYFCSIVIIFDACYRFRILIYKSRYSLYKPLTVFLILCFTDSRYSQHR